MIKRVARRGLATARRLHGRYVYRHQLRLVTWLRTGRHHAAPIDPLRNLWVDPAAITTYIPMERADYLRIRGAVGLVEDGDWDLAVTPLAQHFVYASVRAHFERGVPWSETELYDYAMAGIDSGGLPYHGCTTLAAVEERLGELERLFERVRRDGYRSQLELAREPNAHPLQRNQARPPELDEIVVCIGRDGDVIFVDGVHRLSIAKAAGVPSVPVTVLRRHQAWQAQRDRVARDPSGFTPTDLEHPDLVDVRARPTASPAPQRSR